MTKTNYSQVIKDYTTQMRGMFAAPPGAALQTEAVRGAGVEVPIDVLADRAEKMVDTSRSLGNLTISYLDSKSQPLREAAEMKLLAQANAEVEVAFALLEAAGDEASGSTKGTTRGGRSADSEQTMTHLIGVLEAPLDDGMTPFFEKLTTRGAKSSDIASARTALTTQVDFSLESIVHQAAKSGSKALDTLLGMDTGLLQQGVALLNQQAADLIAKVSSGLNDTLKRLANSAMQLLLQAYDWVLALIGKDAEQTARKKVKEWIDELRSSYKSENDVPNLASSLINKVFDTTSVTEGLDAHLAKSTATLDTLNKTVEDIETIGASYEVKAKQAESFLKLIGFVKMLPLPVDKLPYIQVAVAAVVLGLMGYVLYAGYDHVDSGSVTFFQKFKVNIPDRVTGIRATLVKNLVLA